MKMYEIKFACTAVYDNIIDRTSLHPAGANDGMYLISCCKSAYIPWQIRY